jgi:hypothetical protein
MWVAAAGSIVTALSAALSDNVFDINDATQVGITIVSIAGTMYAVWKTDNRKGE